MEYTNLKLEIENAVATIRLDRPNALNAISPGLLADLEDAVGYVEKDESIKAVVIRGEGRAFCAGADLVYFESAFQDPDELHKYLTRLNQCLFKLEELPVPVIAVVHGFALAAGLELMMACDMALAAENARLGDQHTNFGLMPGGGSTQRLPRLVGMQLGMELLTTGRWLSGTEAAECGLVLRAVPEEELDAALEGLLSPLRVKSRPGLGWIKTVTRQGKDLPVRSGVALETFAFVQYVASSSHPTEGLQAFKEKRQPEF